MVIICINAQTPVGVHDTSIVHCGSTTAQRREMTAGARGGELPGMVRVSEIAPECDNVAPGNDG
jgi:hypothetical protein